MKLITWPASGRGQWKPNIYLLLGYAAGSGGSLLDVCRAARVIDAARTGSFCLQITGRVDADLARTRCVDVGVNGVEARSVDVAGTAYLDVALAGLAREIHL